MTPRDLMLADWRLWMHPHETQANPDCPNGVFEAAWMAQQERIEAESILRPVDKDDGPLKDRIAQLKKIHPQEKGCMNGELILLLEEIRSLRNLAAAQNAGLLIASRTIRDLERKDARGA